MTYREIFKSAVALIAEDVNGDTIADYEDRALYILATFCNQTAAIDARYRTANGCIPSAWIGASTVNMNAIFALHEVFVPVAAYYLASALVLDENEEMSEHLFALYTDAIASIAASLPCSTAPVTDAYGLI